MNHARCLLAAGLLLLFVFLGAACRTQPLELDDLGGDSSQLPDLAAPSSEPCSPKFPRGFCPPATTCCPFSCWGGSDETGWCAPSPGCPVC